MSATTGVATTVEPAPTRDDIGARCPAAATPATRSGLHQQAPFDVSAVPPYAFVTSSGLATCVVRPGTGSENPTIGDRVEVHYAGWSTDGTIFEASEPRGQTATFSLRAVIPGWTEGLGLMVEGEVRRLWVPEPLAYAGHPGRPAGMLVFDIELVRIIRAAAP
ncbi:MAG: FKBP-type peptidyl-prolyl cis-trans isomerase [Deltaproteobacteria bacterium]|nr:FKBP-type peptidyl-prolyl cis-trans isomerase [Deltaproteobacteria bacterium]